MIRTIMRNRLAAEGLAKWLAEDADYAKSRCVTIALDVMLAHGYTAIVSQDGKGGVTLCNEEGNLEVFEVRDSYAGFCVPTDCGRVLEFCRTVTQGR